MPVEIRSTSEANDLLARRVAALHSLVVADRRIALARKARAESVTALNQILADTLSLGDLYTKHRWQASGATFFQLQRLFDKHREEQQRLADAIAERVQILGGAAIAMAADVARTTVVVRAPRHTEGPEMQLARLAEAHARLLHDLREVARRALEREDAGTHNLLVRDVIRTHETQAWFVHELLQRPGAPAP
jgi:starvation-inducible DNA-binding protein